MPLPALQHILYVDDEPDMRMLVQLTLENSMACRVTACDSGLNAIEAALAEPPQLILLDAMMPVMDGPMVLAEMRRHASLSGIPIIFLTAKSQSAEQQRLLDLGAAGVIAKPFALDVLAGQVRNLWQQQVNSIHG